MKDFNNIRRAERGDIPAINALLCQVLMVHAKLRPDIFIPGTKKLCIVSILMVILIAMAAGTDSTEGIGNSLAISWNFSYIEYIEKKRRKE